ncbi:MAG: isocitrate/isopropylmalate dehydrogenase family protein [Candidatus Thalassarchaeaceae archaeon]|jgi:3-isopropylmalate dehydrogenase|nr:isocitrate/isopropylmalate dehydrogenase family protein [Candidatus Thalassarchaeaceae archaeon]MDP7043939.1 isocitrate/isopropylmalate dehydrogenase family protein [Candidatus Thalassarchaeaceae archaeon]
MATYRLTILPGDGTGPEVIKEAEKLLDCIQNHTDLKFDRTIIPCGGQYWLDTGDEWPPGSFEHCRDHSDAILLGAIGWPGANLPNGDLAGGQVILGLRSGLNLYANVRPIKLFNGVKHKIHSEFSQVWNPDKVDILVLRENTEGLYHSLLRRSALRAQGKDMPEVNGMTFDGIEGEVAWDVRPISKNGTEKLIRLGFEYARRRNGAPNDGVSSVTCVDKSNVTRGCQLFRRVFHEIGKEYSDIKRDEAYIDAFTMWMVRNPEWFDVVVTSNMFGDILTDLGSVLQGGMGMAASANIGDNHALFEPVHGSSPKHAGKGEVNPIATLNSVQMMVEWLGLRHDDTEALEVSRSIEQAISEHISDGTCLTYDLGGTASTSEVGSGVAARLEALLQGTHIHST